MLNLFRRFSTGEKSINDVKKKISVNRRRLCLESLENRELLSVSAGEYVWLRENYADLELSAKMADYNVIEITAKQLSEANLRNAITAAGETAKSDLIVLRTTASQNAIQLSGRHLNFSVDNKSKGDVMIVGLPDTAGKSLTLDADSQSRVLMVTSGTVLKLGGVTVTNGYGSHSPKGYTGHELGGGLHNNGSLTIVKSTFTVNSAGEGGAIANAGQLFVYSSTFFNNIAANYDGGDGGAIYNSRIGTVKIVDTNIIGNAGSRYGGGIQNNGGIISIYGSTIAGNRVAHSSSVTYGGGISNAGELTIVNSLVVGNSTNSSTSGQGGGIYNDKTLTVTNSTIAGNTAGTDGGIRSGRQTTLDNSILCGNITNAAANGRDLWIVDSSLSSVSASHSMIGTYHNGIGKQAAFQGSSNNILGNGKTTAFKNYAPYAAWSKNLWKNWDFRLKAGADEINAGSNSLLSEDSVYDLDGKPRKIGSVVDMGAYEYGDWSLAALDVTASLQTNGTIKLTWNTVPNATRYSVWFLNENNTWESLSANITGTALTDASPLTNGIRVYAVRAYYGTAASAPKTVKLDMSQPALAFKAREGNVKLGWDAIAGATYYQIYRKYESGDWGKIGTTEKLNYVDETLPAGVDVTYMVRGMLPDSRIDTRQITTRVVPAAPIVSVANNPGNVTLSWQSVNGATAYRVYRYDNGTWVTLATQAGTEYVDSATPVGTAVKYFVRAYAGDLRTDSAEVTGKAAAVVPALSFQSRIGNVKLGWKEIAGATYYQIHRKVENGAWVRIGTTENLSYIDSTLPAGVDVTYMVRGMLPDSRIDTQQITTRVVPAAPVVGVKNREGNVKLTWKEVNGATSYAVYGNYGNGWQLLRTTTALQYVDAAGPAGQAVTYFVRAYAGDLFTDSVHVIGTSLHGDA